MRHESKPSAMYIAQDATKDSTHLHTALDRVTYEARIDSDTVRLQAEEVDVPVLVGSSAS